MSARDAIERAARGVRRFVARRWRLALGLALLYAALSLVDLRGCARVLDRTGPVVAWAALASFVASHVCDSFAWRFVGRAAGAPISLGRALRLRLGMDAVGLSMPGGTLTGELSGPFLLRALAGAPLPAAASTVVLRKWGTVAVQTLLLACAALFAAPFLATLSRELGAAVDVRWLVAIAACAFAAVTVVTRQLLRVGPAERLGRLLARIPAAPVRRLAEAGAAGLAHADAITTRFFDARDGRALALVSISLGRALVECLGSLVVLRVLGASPGLGDVVATKSILVVARTLVFVVPAGLGVRELGTIALVSAMPGGTPEVAAAALVVGRSVEVAFALAWVALSGYTPLDARRRHPPAE